MGFENRSLKWFFMAIFLAVGLAACSEGDPAARTAEYLASAREKLAAGDYQGAVIEFKNAVQLSPTSIEPRLALGRAYLGRYHVLAAEKELERAADLGAPAEEVYPALFRVWMLADKPAEVIETFTALPAEATADPKIAVYYVDALLAQGRIEDARSALADLPREDPGVRVREAQLALADGDRDGALALLAEVLKADPDHVDANALLGRLRAADGDIAGAKAALEVAHKADPFAPAIGLALASVALEQHDLEAAGAVLDQIESNGITYLQATYLRSVIALESQDFRTAKEQAEKVLAANPRFAPAVLVAGVASSALGNDEVAVNYLQRFAEEPSAPTVARRALAWSNLRLGRPDAALEVLESSDSADWTADELRLATTAAVASRNYDQAMNLLDDLAQKQGDGISAKAALAALKLATGDRAGAEAIIAEIDDPAKVKTPEDKLRLALVQMRAGHYERARALANELRNLPDYAAQGAMLVGMTYLGSGDDARAVAAFEAALAADPTDSGALRALVQLHLKAGRGEEARQRVERALAASPDNPELETLLAYVKNMEGDRAGAEAALREAVKSAPESATARIRLAKYLLSTNKPGEALAVAREAVKIAPDNADAYKMVGYAELASGETQAAIATFRRAVAIDAKDSEAHFGLAQAYAKVNDVAGAEQELRATLEQDPRRQDARLVLARLLVTTGRVEDAKPLIETLEQAVPGNPDVIELRALYELGVSGAEAAVPHYRKAYEADPKPARAIVLARAQWAAGGREAALATLDAAREASSESLDLIIETARYQRALGNRDAAIATFASAVELAPDNAVAQNDYAWLLWEAGRPDEALAHARRAYDLDAERPQIKDTLAVILLAQGQAERALGLLREAARALPDDLDVQIHLAEALIATDDVAEARRVLRTARDRAGEGGRERIEALLKKIGQD